MARFSEAFLDPDKVREGTFVEWRSGIRLRLRMLWNEDVKAATRDALAAMDPKEKPTTLEEIEDAPFFRDVVSEHVLVGWENVEDEESGEPLAYSPSTGRAYFDDPRLPHFFPELIELARRHSTFKLAAQESDRKN